MAGTQAEMGDTARSKTGKFCREFRVYSGKKLDFQGVSFKFYFFI